MTKTHYGLTVLLVLQLLLAAGLYWYHEDSRSSKRQPFVNFDPAKIGSIDISGSGNSLTLVKQDDHWRLPEPAQLPAQDDKLEGLLSRLQRFQPNWPVTTTAAALERFQVADDKFVRRVRFYADGKMNAEWYLGAASGLRKSYIRKAGDEAVYTIDMSKLEWPVKSDEWLDKSLLAAADVTGIKGPDYALTKTGDVWSFAAAEGASPEAAAPLAQDKARQLALALSGLRVLGVADKTPEGGGVSLEVTTANGGWTYRFMRADDKYYVIRNDRNAFFAISQFDFDRIAGIDKAGLVETKKPTEAEPDKAEPSDQDKAVSVDKMP